MTKTLPPPRRKRIRFRPVETPAAVAFRTGLTWLLASLSLILIPLFGQVPSWTLGLFAVCAAWRYALEKLGKPLPSMWVRLLLFLPVAYMEVRIYSSLTGAAGLLALLIALLALKILELRTPRDFTVVALLSYFMALSVLFYYQSLVLCVYLAVALVMNAAALITGHGRMRGVWPTLRLSLGMGVQALPLVALMFIVFPRVQAGFLHRFGTSQTGQTGMSDTLQPGSFSALVQSSDPVFRAQITKSPRPVTQNQLYWRGQVLERCEHPLSWRAVYQGGSELPRARGEVEQQITIIPNGQRWMFALDRPVGAFAPANLKAEYAASQVLRSRETIYHVSIYTVYSSLGASTNLTLDNKRREFLTHLPSDFDGNPRAKALAKSWRQQARSDDDVLRAASNFFQANNFAYTLNPGLLTQHAALDQFLFETRKGFCEHYAAAYCTLMRAAGIPARIVVGYQGGELNQYGHYYTVRQSDAHAWAEVWLNGRGWTREDPTAFVAPDRVAYDFSALDGSFTDAMRLDRLSGLNSSGSFRWLMRNTSQIWDNLDQQWNLMVLGYDQDTQLTVFERLGLDKLDWVGGSILTLALAFTILGIGGGLIYLLDRRPARQRDAVARDYERFCRKLAQGAGLTRAATEGPLDFARRAEERLPTQSESIRRITQLYVASRYARDGDASVAAEFHGAVRAFQVQRATVREEVLANN